MIKNVTFRFSFIMKLVILLPVVSCCSNREEKAITDLLRLQLRSSSCEGGSARGSKLMATLLPGCQDRSQRNVSQQPE